MKKLFGFLLVCVVSAALTVCDDSSSKGGGKAASGTFTKAYNNTTPAGNSAIFSEADAKIQYLYLASEINGSGYITKIRVQQGVLTSEVATCHNVTIKMGHTDLTVLGTTWANNVETGQGSEITVLDNKTITIPAAAADSWIEIALDTPFNYNGKDNLIVDVERTSGCSAAVPTNFTNVPNRVAADIVADSASGTAEWNATTAFGSYGDLLCMQFVFAGGDNKLEYATTGQPLPFMASPSHIRQQMLYKAGDINGSGVITGVGFAVATSPGSDCNYTVTVRLGHTNLDELGTTTFEGNYSGSSTIVANDVSFKVPANAAYASYVWLPFSRSFTYDGASNLIVDVDVSDGSAGMNLRCDDLGLNTRVYSVSGGALTSSNHRFAVKFRFAGGTADVIGSGNHDLYPPFHGSVTGQFQPLYIASELGLNGSINSIGFRLQNDSVAESYGNITIVMGHSDLDALALGQAYLDNMYGEKTVFTGTVEVPDGLKAGDWDAVRHHLATARDLREAWLQERRET